MMRHAASMASFGFAIGFFLWACVPRPVLGQARPGADALQLAERRTRRT